MFDYKLFNFQGSPVIFKITFLLLFLILPPSMVIGLFLSVLIHELSHTYIANKLGYRVNRIFIDFLGGGAEINLNNIHEKDSIKIVAAGPLINLLLFLLCFYIYPFFESFDIIYVFLKDLYYINLLLFLFNVLPIRPLDGGLLFRDILIYKMRRQREKAIKISNYTSLFVSVCLLIFSLSMLDLIMIVFSCIFLYYSFLDLGWLKKN